MRPRTAGEIFDRGFGVLIRSAARAGALFAIAIGIVAGSAGLVFAVPGENAKIVTGFVVVLAAIAPLLWVAGGVVYLIGAEASDVPCSFRDAFRNGRRRSLSLLGTSILGYFVVLGALVPVFVIIIAVGAIASLQMSTAVAVTVSVVVGIPSLLFCIALYALATAVVYVSWSACVFEGRNPIEALLAALKRCCTRPQLKRALAVGLATLTPLFAIELIFMLATALFAFSPESAQHSGSAYLLFLFGLVTALRLFAQLFGWLIGIAWCTVFSLDARIRLEGLDLAVALAAAERPITAS